MIVATPIVGAIKILFNYYNEKYGFIERIKPTDKNSNNKTSIKLIDRIKN